jgi:hypothetical protein
VDGEARGPRADARAEAKLESTGLVRRPGRRGEEDDDAGDEDGAARGEGDVGDVGAVVRLALEAEALGGAAGGIAVRTQGLPWMSPMVEKVSPPNTAPTTRPATPAPPRAAPRIRCVPQKGAGGEDGADVGEPAGAAVGDGAAVGAPEAAGAGASARGGTWTVETPGRGSTVTVVWKARLPGAVASMVWGPGSIGMADPKRAASMGLPLRRTSRPGARASSGTMRVRRESFGSRRSARRWASSARPASALLRARARASLKVVQALAVWPLSS